MPQFNSYKNAFKSKQIPFLYTQGNLPPFPADNGILAPHSKGLLYQTGMLLSKLTTGTYAGMFINYEADATDPEQAIPTHVLADSMANDLTGVDLTNVETATETVNRVNAYALLTPLQFWEAPLVEANSPANITGFHAAIKTASVGSGYYGSTPSNVLIIQGVVEDDE